ncbi:MAG: AI-2E family transporter [Absicoccus sp.]|uniref:AI-2E family transporter n=1 Tax=Absicoccus intestinalis TaxID=2926319 RepID=A0ABU4WLZ6_9FIRM|nr:MULTISPECIES: AI-2E family transporter [Absicoccus]MDD6459449.1 AI-2E family transporter [Absicoccus porci]MDX8417086.1 AI-2E family transporter [Absicoccus sp. CLA-KB-P134]MDY3035039.1 AI-2E family transporter [Absicoccus sp.]
MEDHRNDSTDRNKQIIKPNRIRDRLKVNKQYTEISLYVIGTCVILYILYGILSSAGNFFAALGNTLAWIGSILKPMAIGFVFAYLLYPLCEKVEAQCKKRPFFQERPKSAHYFGVVITIGGIILGLLVLISLLILTITQQFSSLHDASLFQIIQAFTQSLNQMYQGLLTWLEKMNVKSEQARQIVDAIRNGLTSHFGTGVQGIGHTLNNIKSVGSTILFSIIFSVYFMLDWPSLHTYWENVAEVLFGEKTTPHLNHIWRDISTVFAGYIRGQMTDAIFMMIAVSVTFSIAHIPYGIVIGVLTGIGNMVPYLGPIVGYGLTLISGILSGNVQVIIIGCIILLIIQGVDGAVVNPRLLSKNVQIHPMLVLLGVIAGNKTGGFIGMLIAVPITALLKIWFERGIRKIKERRKVIEEG